VVERILFGAFASSFGERSKNHRQALIRRGRKVHAGVFPLAAIATFTALAIAASGADTIFRAFVFALAMTCSSFANGVWPEIERERLHCSKLSA
jgi:L-asparaginase II